MDRKVKCGSKDDGISSSASHMAQSLDDLYKLGAHTYSVQYRQRLGGLRLTGLLGKLCEAISLLVTTPASGYPYTWSLVASSSPSSSSIAQVEATDKPPAVDSHGHWKG
ncbi:hypothetical protein A9Z42_0068570 [Trichoderma parareesei]|uniref:Uncharacterized protein n=1 Tax=Trichoderma parareesei TaxID=858221 RepID=A0A2H2ZN07_TRIPA|nr:hypothetical protein A9Z42_0068570 [Trichoderma parareesei]